MAPGRTPRIPKLAATARTALPGVPAGVIKNTYVPHSVCYISRRSLSGSVRKR